MIDDKQNIEVPEVNEETSSKDSATITAASGGK